jgi:hypothetical protein
MTAEEIAIQLHEEGRCVPHACPYCTPEATEDDLDESTEAEEV